MSLASLSRQSPLTANYLYLFYLCLFFRSPALGIRHHFGRAEGGEETEEIMMITVIANNHAGWLAGTKQKQTRKAKTNNHAGSRRITFIRL
jgi:hypothetical protein